MHSRAVGVRFILTGGVFVRMVRRRVVLASVAALAFPFPANSESPEELNVEVEEGGGVTMTRYAADRVGRRP